MGDRSRSLGELQSNMQQNATRPRHSNLNHLVIPNPKGSLEQKRAKEGKTCFSLFPSLPTSLPPSLVSCTTSFFNRCFAASFLSHHDVFRQSSRPSGSQDSQATHTSKTHSSPSLKNLHRRLHGVALHCRLRRATGRGLEHGPLRAHGFPQESHKLSSRLEARGPTTYSPTFASNAGFGGLAGYFWGVKLQGNYACPGNVGQVEA